MFFKSIHSLSLSLLHFLPKLLEKPLPILFLDAPAAGVFMPAAVAVNAGKGFLQDWPDWRRGPEAELVFSALLPPDDDDLFGEQVQHLIGQFLREAIASIVGEH